MQRTDPDKRGTRFAPVLCLLLARPLLAAGPAWAEPTGDVAPRAEELPRTVVRDGRRCLQFLGATGDLRERCEGTSSTRVLAPRTDRHPPSDDPRHDGAIDAAARSSGETGGEETPLGAEGHPAAPGYAAARTSDLRLAAGRYAARGEYGFGEVGRAVFTEVDAELGHFITDGVRLAFSMGLTSPELDYETRHAPERALQVGLHLRGVLGRPAPFSAGPAWRRLRPFAGSQVFFGPFDTRVAISGGLVWPLTRHLGLDLGLRASSRPLDHRGDPPLELGVGAGLFFYR